MMPWMKLTIQLLFAVLIITLPAVSGAADAGDALRLGHAGSDRAERRLQSLKNNTRLIVEDIKYETLIIKNQVEILSTIDGPNKELARSLTQDIKRFRNIINEISDFYKESAALLADIEKSKDVETINSKAEQLELFKGEVLERKKEAKSIVEKIKESENIELPVPERWPDKIVIAIDEAVYLPYLELNQVEQFTQVLTGYIKHYTKMPFELWKLSAAELQESYEEGEIDIAVTYNKAVTGSNSSKGILTIMRNGRTTQQCLIVVDGKSEITHLGDLKGKAVAVLDNHVKQNLDDYFYLDLKKWANIHVASNHKSAFMGMRMGEYDAVIGFENALTDDHGNPINGYRIISRSRPVENNLLYIKQSKQDGKNSEMDKIIKGLQKAHKSRALRKIFDVFNIDQLAGVKESMAVR